MRRVFGSAIGLLILLYPPAVYLGIHCFAPWQIASVLAILLLGRYLVSEPTGSGRIVFLAALVLYCAIAAWNNNLISLLFYPVMINLGLLLMFGASLYFPPTLVERLARLQHPNLPPEGVSYTRKVTLLWCLFFLVNGTVAAATAIWSSIEVWSLYNGFIAYLLVGLLMAGEYWVRLRTQDYAR